MQIDLTNNIKIISQWLEFLKKITVDDTNNDWVIEMNENKISFYNKSNEEVPIATYTYKQHIATESIEDISNINYVKYQIDKNLSLNNPKNELYKLFLTVLEADEKKTQQEK